MGEDPDPGEQTVDDLYGLAPGEFTAARERAVKAARDQGRRGEAARLATLRRPTQAAWALNQLARDHADLLAELLEVAAAMRGTRERLDAETVRELTGRRARLVEELVATAVRDTARGGGRLGDQALQGVEQTLAAAVSDTAAAEKVTAGRLVAALAVPTALPDLPVVFTAVTDTSNTPQPGPGAGGAPASAGKPPTTRRAPQPDATAELEHQLHAAQEAAARAERELADADDQAARAQQEVERAQAALERARFAARHTAHTRERATERLEELRRQANRVKTALDRVREGRGGDRGRQP